MTSLALKRKLCEEVHEHWMHLLLLAYSREITLDDLSGKNCPLCKHMDRCWKCPVVLLGGDKLCTHTPYVWVRLLVIRLRVVGSSCPSYGKLSDDRCWQLLTWHIRSEMKFLEKVSDEWTTTWKHL